MLAYQEKLLTFTKITTKEKAMNIIESIENEYRSKKNYGITFSIEPEAYSCDLAEDRVSFGDNTTELNCGTFFNWQDIIVDGEHLGFLEEAQSGKLLHPMTVSFATFLRDCDEEELTEEERNNPHLYEGEFGYYYYFATLQQFVDYQRSIGKIKN